MIYAQLKKTIIYHLISGITLSAVIITLFLLSKYENNLFDTIGKFQHIKINAFKMKQAMADMDSVMNRINTVLPSEYSSKSHRELLLFALDDIKMTFKGSEIAVTHFNEKEGELFLPVNISFSLDDYSTVIKRIGYLQSMKIPQFKIKHVGIDSGVDKQTNVAKCIIEGSLRMPLERLKDDKK